ncbi:MAG: DUF177 domain-containing protein [Pseudobacteriovorax sp.]|nr:DUF177 domain-containing protein [Pseudobacteriovorax sp.]
MLIDTRDLRTSQVIDIIGNEEFLNSVYKVFPKLYEQPLTGKILVSRTEYDGISVKGTISFTPKVDCSRCTEAIPWPLDKAFEVVYRPAIEASEGQIDLPPQDLETYYLSDDEKIDLTQLLIDFTAGELPSQLVKKSEDQKSCLVCDKDISKDVVFESGEQFDNNPFAILKGLKLPE